VDSVTVALKMKRAMFSGTIYVNAETRPDIPDSESYAWPRRI
jgi:hypothetical protein